MRYFFQTKSLLRSLSNRISKSKETIKNANRDINYLQGRIDSNINGITAPEKVILRINHHAGCGHTYDFYCFYCGTLNEEAYIEFVDQNDMQMCDKCANTFGPYLKILKNYIYNRGYGRADGLLDEFRNEIGELSNDRVPFIMDIIPRLEKLRIYK